MTFEQFKSNWQNYINICRPEYIRAGQSLMNYLYMIWPAEYNRIVDEYQLNSIDCFYIDDRIDKTFIHLKSVWYNYPN